MASAIAIGNMAARPMTDAKCILYPERKGIVYCVKFNQYINDEHVEVGQIMSH